MALFSFPTFDLQPAPYHNGRAESAVKRAGILGGLAPQSTGLFYDSITRYCLRQGLPDFPKLLINSLNPWPVVDILARKDMKALYRYLERELLLIQDRVDFMVMVCNSVHAVLEALREMAQVPIRGIQEEVCREVAFQSIRKVGVLGTRTTIESGLYQRELADFGIEYRVLSPERVQRFDDCIFQEMLHGRQLGTMRRLILEGIRDLSDEGCQAVVLACTELPLFVQQNDTEVPLFPSTQILAEVVVKECLGTGSSSPSLLSFNQAEHLPSFI